MEFHQVSLGPAAIQPGVAEVVPEPVRERVDAALAAAAGDHLVDAGGGQRLSVARAQPQVDVAAPRVTRVVAQAGQLGQPDRSL